MRMLKPDERQYLLEQLRPPTTSDVDWDQHNETVVSGRLQAQGRVRERPHPYIRGKRYDVVTYWGEKALRVDDEIRRLGR